MILQVIEDKIDGPLTHSICRGECVIERLIKAIASFLEIAAGIMLAGREAYEVNEQMVY